MTKQPKYTTSEFDTAMADATDSPLTKSLQISAEPVAPAPAVTEPVAGDDSEEAFYLKRYLDGFQATGSSDLPFKVGLAVTPITTHVVEGMRTVEGQPMMISTPGCYDINGAKLSFRFIRTGPNVRASTEEGWVVVRREGFIGGVKFSDVFADSAFSPESGCITEGGSYNHATGKTYGEELILCCRPFAAYVAQAKAQAIVSSRNLKAIGHDASDADGASRVADLCASRGVPDGAVRPMVTSKGWGNVRTS